MRLPVGWPDLIRVFSKDYEKLKLAELLAFCGDRGVYLVGLTDIADDHKKLFIDLLSLIGEYIRVVSTKRQAREVHNKLIDVLAKLELTLPLYWCTISRHMLIHVCELISELGAFSVWNMLPVERFHVLIKKMARSSKGMLQSLDTHYDLFLECQQKFHFDKSNWDHKNRKTLSTARPFQDRSGIIEYPKHKCKPVNLEEATFEQILMHWGLVNPAFKALRGRYQTYVRNIKKQNKKNKGSKQKILKFRKWKPTDRQLNSDELLMRRVGNSASSVPWVTVDGTKFCTTGSQLKSSKSDNSCILCRYKSNGKETLAVGRIHKLYVHKLHDGADSPWDVFVGAEWFEHVGLNPVNGLLQIRKNDCWNKCDFTNLRNCLSINCVFWLSDPFADKTLMSLYDVITHYDAWSHPGVDIKTMTAHVH
jgi:hypothetical protein